MITFDEDDELGHDGDDYPDDSKDDNVEDEHVGDDRFL